MAFRIYPSIGFARLGHEVPQFFIGPEIPGHPGFEPDSQGLEAPVSRYKTDDPHNDQLKRQAARFRIFEVQDGSAPREVQLPAGATVQWQVHLVNKKAAVQRAESPPSSPQRPTLIASPAPFLIDPGVRTITGASASGVKFDTGEFQGRRVPLGELRTDKKQNLLVLGGFGFSSSPNNTNLTNFYTNPGWHDDVSDGPVTARIQLADGTVISDIAGAWVVVGPPDYAPEIQGVVTLYDILAEVGTSSFQVPLPNPVSFTRDVFPLLLRTRRLRWVNVNPNWSKVSDNWPVLADSSNGAAALRQENAEFVRETATILSDYNLTSVQDHVLTEWSSGHFASDWTGLPQPAATVAADGMTQAALGATVGQGFFPGIEGGIILTDPTLYSTPFDFRLNHAQIKPGDITALMALPWQTDFLACNRNWWPSQRPNDVRVSATSETRLAWDRGITSYLSMVHNFGRLGFITAQRDNQGNVVFAEEQRASTDAIV